MVNSAKYLPYKYALSSIPANLCVVTHPYNSNPRQASTEGILGFDLQIAYST